MKNLCIAILLVVITLASCAQKHPNKDTNEPGGDTAAQQKPKETWENNQNYKDSLWNIFSESTDEIEAERAREMLYEIADQADWYRLAEKDHEKYKARVEAEFQQLLSAFPEYTGLFSKEKEKWECYHEAVLAMISLEDHGSSGTLNIIGALNQSVDLWDASFHNLWLYKQNQDVWFPQTKFTSRMIDDAYTAFFNVATDNWYNPYKEDHKEGLEEYKESISNERKMWDDWMEYRATVAKALPKDLRKIYNGCTNLTMRMKLHQLKNQNAGLGLINDYIDSCLLPDSCSDKELLDYPGFNVVLKRNSDDLN